MEIDRLALSDNPSDDERSRSGSRGNDEIFSTESISSALSEAVSEASLAGSEASLTSQDTCLSKVPKNVSNEHPNKPDTNGACHKPSPARRTPLESLFANIPKGSGTLDVAAAAPVATPPRRKKTFVVEKVDEPELDKDDIWNSKESVHGENKDIPLDSQEKSSPVKRKDSTAKRKNSQDDTAKDTSPSRRRKASWARRLSIDAISPLRIRKKSRDESKRNRAGTGDSVEDAEENSRDQLLELPKIEIKKRDKKGRRVSYNDVVMKIPTDDEGDDDVFTKAANGDDIPSKEMDWVDEEDENIVPKLKKRRPLFRPRDQKLKVVLVLLMLLIIGGVTCIWMFYKKQLYEVKIGKKITFNEDTRTLIVHQFGTDKVALKGVLGLNIPHLFPYLCAEEHLPTELCLRWPGYAILNIKYWDATKDIGCYNITWENLSDNFIPKDCFGMSQGNWYGGGLVREQRWPIEKQQLRTMPFVTGNILNGEYGSVIQAYWLSSQGIAISVPMDVPLWAGVNALNSKDDGGLCLSATYTGPYRQLSRTVGSKMRYQMCKGPNFRLVHEFMISGVVGTLDSTPGSKLLRHPGWSTWGKYGKNITQEKVMALYNEIQQNNFSASQLEIYDKWEPSYGDLIFDKEKFPNVKELVNILNDSGIEVMACIHPFVDTRSGIFQIGVDKGYFVMNEDDVVPGLTYWWDSVGAVVDFTSAKTSVWFKERLLSLQNETGIASFRFDAGQVSWLPHMPHFSEPLVNPVEYSKKYVEFADSLSAKTIVSSSFHNQDIPVIIRIHDRNPTWGYDNGLKSIIPTVLTLNLLGYPYLQLQVGGGGDNMQGLRNTSFADSFPTRELYLRTMQIAIFLPSFQFAVLPWQYDEEMTTIARQYVEFHRNFVLPRIQTLFSNYTMKGLPLIRPIWWLENSQEARIIDSEFLVGDDILVAPILDQGASKRDIYLPNGNWKDPFKNMIIGGGTWLKDYSSPNHIVPYFVHV